MTVSTPVVRPAQDRHAINSVERASWTQDVARIINGHWFRCVVIAVLAILIHSPALQGQRIWDDQYLAHDNPFIKSPLLIPESFRHYLFLDSLSAHYRPVQNISYIFDYFFWNTDEFGFHLTNVLLHAGSGIFLYLLLQQLFASLLCRCVTAEARARAQKQTPLISAGAFFVGILWVVHPVHSAAVDYISGRADSLSFLFAAGGWLLFLKAQKISQPVLRTAVYALAAISGLLALLSREIGCIWIVLFVAYLLFVERKSSFRRRTTAIVCCALILGAYAGLRQLPGERATPPAQANWTVPVRAVLMARSLGDYARLMIMPTNLHMDRTVVDPAGWRSNPDWRRMIGTEYLSILGLLLLAAFVYGGIKKGRGQHLRIFGAIWFIAAYLPISNIVQLNATVAEHWLYLPAVGFLIFVFGCAMELPLRSRPVAVAFTVIAVSGLSVRSFVRSGDWADEETFYQRTLAVGGESARISVNLAQVYARRGDYTAAEKILRHVLERTPDYPSARINLGNVLLHQGKAAEAEEFFRSLFNADARVSKEYPRTWVAAVNLAVVRHKAGDDNGAFAVLETERAVHPGVWELIVYEAELRREVQGPGAALELIGKFSHEHWWHYGAAVALGRLQAEIGDIPQADAALAHASWLDVHDAEALHLLAAIKLRENNFEAALRAQRCAVKRQPDQPSQYVLLSNILERLGRNDEARAALAEVSKLRALAESSPRQTL